MQEIVQILFKGENPKSVFEVGCGSGYYLQGFEEVGGLDVISQNVNACRERFPEHADNFVLADARQGEWPVEDKSYDVVFTVGTILLLPDPYPAIKEMLRIARHSVILAELQDDKESDYGGDGTGHPQADPEHQLRIYRDYRKVFEKLGFKTELKGHILGKTIIKCSV